MASEAKSPVADTRNSGRTHSKPHEGKARYHAPVILGWQTLRPDGSGRIFSTYNRALSKMRPGEAVVPVYDGDELGA